MDKEHIGTKNISHELRQEPPLAPSEVKRYCSKCGSPINEATKTCTGCGRQFFKGVRYYLLHMNTALVALSCLLVVSLIVNMVQVIHVADITAENKYIAELRVPFASNEEMKAVLTSSTWRQTHPLEDVEYEIRFEDEGFIFVNHQGDAYANTYTLDYESSTILVNGRFGYDVIKHGKYVYLRQNPQADQAFWVLYRQTELNLP